MTRRIVVEEPCQHGTDQIHCVEHGPTITEMASTCTPCPGGSRTVLDGIPDEWVQRGVDVYNRYRNHFEEFDDAPDFIEKALEAAVFGEPR